MPINWEFWLNIPDETGRSLDHIAAFCDEFGWSFELFWSGDNWIVILITESENDEVVELSGESNSISQAIHHVFASLLVYYEEGTW